MALKTTTAKHTSCLTCQGRTRNEWCVLEGDDLALLNQVKICNTYQPGQTIFYQGNPCLGVYCVEEGTVAVRKTDASGRSVIVRMAHTGDTLGYRAFFAGEPYRASADALQGSRVCFVDRAAVRRLLDRNPMVGLSFLKHMARDLEEAEEAKLHAAALPVRARLAHLLLMLRERFGQSLGGGGTRIELPLSRQDIAAMIGTRPETVARAVRSFEDEGIANFQGREVLVNNLEALLNELNSAE